VKIRFSIVVLAAALAACGVDKMPQSNGASDSTIQPAATTAQSDQPIRADESVSSEKLAPLQEKSSDEEAKKEDGEKKAD
jgi:hypothetical protein